VIDPRGAVIGRRLASVGRIAGFYSAKGGVGKTVCSTLAGALLARGGRRVGLLDLDLQGASAHSMLGVEPRLPQEDKGILPLRVTEGLSLMSAAVFAGNRALALRGPEVSDAMLEMLAVTQWGGLDYLLVDMPPGIAEEVLDLARLIPRMEAVVISTPAALSLAVVERMLPVLAEMHVAVPGIIANMTRGDGQVVAALARRTGTPFAGEVPYDESVEGAVGNIESLCATVAGRAVAAALAAMRFT